MQGRPQGKRYSFRRIRARNQRLTPPVSSKNPPKISLLRASGNFTFRDEFARDCPLQRRVTCEPDFLSLAARCALRVSDAARAGAGSAGRASARSDTGGTPAPGARIIHVNEYRIDHLVRKLGTRPAREPSPIHQPVAPGCRRKSGRRIRSRFGRSGSSPRPGRSP